MVGGPPDHQAMEGLQLHGPPRHQVVVQGEKLAGSSSGQEVGTQGYVGQRLPVAQYPVIGYVSNPYLGCAMPKGS
jgi:hypothetical protein